MKRLLYIEFLKIYHYKWSRYLTLGYFIVLALIAFGVSQFRVNMGGQELTLAKLGAYNYPLIWNIITYIGVILKFLLAVIVVNNISNEYSNKTIKQNLIDGLSKKQFLGSKVLSTVVFALTSTLLVAFITLVLGTAYNSSDFTFYEGIQFLAYYFLEILALFIIIIFITFLVKKTAFALLILFGWYFIEMLLGTAEFIFRLKVLDQDLTSPTNAHLITSYLPISSASYMVQLPFGNLEDIIMKGEFFKMYEPHWSYIVATVVYILLFIFLSYQLLKKRDL